MPFSPSALSERLRCRRRALPSAAEMMRSAASASSSARAQRAQQRWRNQCPLSAQLAPRRGECMEGVRLHAPAAQAGSCEDS